MAKPPRMHWSQVEQRNTSNFWLLKDGDKEVADLRYNKAAGSMRIKEAGERRLYFMEPVGMMQNRILLKTEYDQHTGEISFARNANNGSVMLGSRQYTFLFVGGQLTIKEKASLHPLVQIEGPLSEDKFERAALLIAYCWHLQLAKAEVNHWLQ